MAKIQKNSKRAKDLIANADSIRCYSLFNGFHGQKLTVHPTLRVNGELREVSDQDFLAAQLHGSWEAYLTQVRENRFALHMNSNLWYEFNATLGTTGREAK